MPEQPTFEDAELLDRVSRVHNATMKASCVFRMARTRLQNRGALGKGAPKRMMAAARELDAIYRKEYGA